MSAVLAALFAAGVGTALAAPVQPGSVSALDLDPSHSPLPLVTEGQSQGFAYSFSGTETRDRASFGARAAPSSTPAQQFGLGHDVANGSAGAFSVGGAVDLSRSGPPSAEGLSNGRGARLDLGPQFGYRSDPHSRLAAEVLGSYFWTRSRWVGRTFVGWRTSEGWAVGPEAWRMGEKFSRCNGAGVAVHDLQFAPFRVGLRLGLETHSPLGRRYIAGFDLSWDNP